MNIVIDFITGVKVGIEFIDSDIKCVIDLLIFRIMFVSDEWMNDE